MYKYARLQNEFEQNYVYNSVKMRYYKLNIITYTRLKFFYIPTFLFLYYTYIYSYQQTHIVDKLYSAK